jgi:undecaprenyl-phosphate galactose phosphotransferase
MPEYYMQHIKIDPQSAGVLQTDSGHPVSARSAVKTILSYKFALFFHDILVMTVVALLCCHYGPGEFKGTTGLLTAVILFSLLASTLFFFSTYRMYSHHLIYSLRFHLLALAQAISYTGLAALVAFFLTHMPVLLADTFLIPVVFVLTIGIVALHRYKWEQIITLLYPIGFALLMLGLMGIVGKMIESPIGVNWILVAMVVVLCFFAMVVSRLVLVHFVFNYLMRKKFRRQVAIVGTDDSAGQFTRHVITLNAPFWIVGAVSIDDKFTCANSRFSGKDCLGGVDDLPRLVDEHNISEIVVTAEDISKRMLIDLLDYCTSRGINAWFSPNLLPIIDVKLYIDRFCGKPMIRLCSQKNNWLFNKMKHGFDALVTIPAFVVQMPLFAFIAAAVKIDSRGPVFYKAQAVGRDGRPFAMYKFRSMRTDADSVIHKDYVTRLIEGKMDNDRSDRPLKITNDPRVTAVGRIIRKLSLDELPQLINVIKGEMSLVGPRPCLPYEFELYQDWHKKRTVVRPGITGLWQVTGRSEVAFEDMILLDLYYIYNRNLLMDLQIMFETIFVVLGKKGAF